MISHLTKCRLLLTTALILSALTTLSAAKTATIKKVWIEHNATINNKKAMKVHCHFTVQGMKGLDGHMGVWIKNSSGKWHNVDGNASSNTGNKYFRWKYTPSYDNNDYSDFWYAPYIDQLNLSPGKNDYSVVVCIYDNNGGILAQSDPVSFTGTGSSNQPAAPARNISGNNSGNSRNSNQPTTKTWREDLGYGGFVIVNQYPNGYILRTRYRTCPNCRGTKLCGSCNGTRICAICRGQGGIVSAGYGTFIPCAMCNRTGQCHLCGGSGSCMCNKGEYPGYVIGSTSTIAPDGTATRSTADYGNHSSSSSSSSSSNKSKSTCPDCGGTRLWKHGKQPEYARPTSQLTGVYHSAGSKCQYCGHYDEHWHSKCATCKHYPGTTNPYR